jgi:hypothetical protein
METRFCEMTGLKLIPCPVIVSLSVKIVDPTYSFRIAYFPKIPLFSPSATFWGRNITSASLPLFGSRMIALRNITRKNKIRSIL